MYPIRVGGTIVDGLLCEHKEFHSSSCPSFVIKWQSMQCWKAERMSEEVGWIVRILKLGLCELAKPGRETPRFWAPGLE